MNLSQLLLRGCVGLIAGVVLWTITQNPYGAILTAVAEPVIHLTEHPAATDLHTAGAETVVNRRDFASKFQRPAMSIPQLTLNIILLTALFATAAKPLSDRNVLRYLYALVALIPLHVLAVLVHVKSIYAAGLGEWSLAHYGVVARNIWSATDHFYRIFGVHAAAVGLWFLFSTDRIGLTAEEVAAPAGRPAKRKRRR